MALTLATLILQTRTYLTLTSNPHEESIEHLVTRVKDDPVAWAAMTPDENCRVMCDADELAEPTVPEHSARPPLARVSQVAD
jgi:hypothetical protein